MVPGNAGPKIGAIFLIFFASLLAVSFPSLSKQTRFLRIHPIIFFIGKHFGTGVIITTAFCHLLQDAFESLQNQAVRERYHRIGDQTGLIILSSLLLIFLVEYISTSYVDHLHADPSAPPSPARTPSPSPSPSITAVTIFEAEQGQAEASTERTPLIPRVARLKSQSRASTVRLPKGTWCQVSGRYGVQRGRHEDPATQSIYPAVLAPRHNLDHHDEYRGPLQCVCVCVPPKPGATLEVHEASDEEEDSEDESQVRPRIGRRRQIVGILVLQLGIMLHSLVIGITLALTAGGDFTSLLIAILFHQLFEGLSLGIRIASLPPPPHPRQRSSLSISPILSFLFAVTTPLGLAIGLLAFSSSNTHRALPSTLLIKGLMSAISAGMLVYAATVEMIAGDFVFGNLLGEHVHGAHAHSEEVRDEGELLREKGDVWLRVVAVGSLLAGVLCMVLVSLVE